LANKHGIDASGFSYGDYQRWQSLLRKDWITDLEGKVAADQELVFLVHGFRKPIDATEKSTSSEQDFESVKVAMIAARPDLSFHFVDVYWDGTFVAVPDGIGALFKLGKLFTKSAMPNSIKVGVSLRKILASMDRPKIHVIGHSLGAQVINNALFNANVESRVPFPDQELHVTYIAPAIGRKPFRSFKKAADNTDQQRSPIHLSLFYNELDIVVAKSNPGEKRIVRFTRFFGNTKLGCNCANEAVKVQKMFARKYPESSVALYDATEIGNDHRWRSYVKSLVFGEYMRAW